MAHRREPVRDENDLFGEVVTASRLSGVIARFTVSRLLISAGVLPAEMTPGDLAGALPRLEEGLSVYLHDDDLSAALTEIRRLAA